jgi:hypothetical protein
VDFGYTARVARVNAAALWALATAPGPEPDLAGYEVVLRETTAPDWTSAIRVGNVTTVTLDIAKDNVQSGVRAADRAGHRSPVAFPQVVTS